MKIKFWWKLNAVLGVFLVLLLRAAVPVGADETRYLYDEAGRLLWVGDEEGRAVFYLYDTVGNIVGIEQSTTEILAPQISSISPGSAAVGSETAVVISGRNFASASVSTNNPGITITGVRTTDTAIRATFRISYSAVEGPTAVTVTNMLGSGTSGFTVLPTPPEITALNPAQGPVSRLVKITGSGFSSVPSENAVLFSGVTAPVFAATPSSILTSVPEGATTGPVTVQLRGSALSNTLTFQVTTSETAPPVIASIFPNAGSVEGGCSVTISGSGFTADTVVCFGKETVAETSFVDSSTLSITTRAGSPGRCDVSASNGNGDSLLQGGYTYLDATRLKIVCMNPVLSSVGLPTNILVSILFSRAVDPTTVNAGSVSLKESGSDSPVEGAFSFGFGNMEAVFAPAAGLKAQTDYAFSITSGVGSADGMPLDKPTAGTFTTGDSYDSTSPGVTPSPAGGASLVPTNSLITFTFTEPMSTPTINTSSLTVTNNGSAVSGSISFGGNDTVAVFTPYSNFLPLSTVTSTLSRRITDRAGNPIAGPGGVGTDAVFGFTTALTTSLEPPRVLSVDPPDGAVEVKSCSSVSVTFSEPMNPATVNSTNFTVSHYFLPGVGKLLPCEGSRSFSDDYRTVTFTPNSCFAVGGFTYYVNVSSKVARMTGVKMPSSFSSSFSVQTESNPMVVTVSPHDNQDSVPLNAHVTIAFDERVNPSTVTASTFYVTTGDSEPLAGTIALSPTGQLAAFKPAQMLLPSTEYCIHYTDGITNIGGQPLQNPGSSNFVTGNEAVDVTGPSILMASPANGAKGVPVNGLVTIKFSEPVDETSVNSGSFVVSHDGVPIPGDFSFVKNGTVVRYAVADSGALQPNAFHQVTVTSGVTDLVGNELVRDYEMGFTTSDVVDTDCPEVTSTVPAAGSTNVSIHTPIEVTFSETLNPIFLDSESITLKQMDQTFLAYNDRLETFGAATENLYAIAVLYPTVPGDFSVSSDRKRLIFVPAYPLLAGGRNYSIELGTMQDLAGNEFGGGAGSLFETGYSAGTDAGVLPNYGTLTVIPDTIPPDGSSTAEVHVTDLVDKNGNTVADGTIVGVTAGGAYGVESAGGSILGGTESESYPGFKFFTVSGGAVSFTYQAPDIPDLPPGDSDIAKIQVFSVDAGGLLVRQVGEDALVTLTR